MTAGLEYFEDLVKVILPCSAMTISHGSRDDSTTPYDE
jgi:hypothetical protein